MKRSGFKNRGMPLTSNSSLRRGSGIKKVSAEKKKRRREQLKGGSSLTENAEGKPCTLRLDGCRDDPDYTVFSHIRRFGWGGAGLKPLDLLGYFGCDLCHEKQERHHPDCTYEDMLRAMGQTLIIQHADGLIKAQTKGKEL
jgi:hypothetical protein